MKMLIEIPAHVYEHAKETSEDSIDETTAMRAIANGTPITDKLGEGCGKMKIEEVLDIIINTNYSAFTDDKQEKAFDMALFALSILSGIKEDVPKLESLGDPVADVLAAAYGRMIEEIENFWRADDGN